MSSDYTNPHTRDERVRETRVYNNTAATGTGSGYIIGGIIAVLAIIALLFLVGGDADDGVPNSVTIESNDGVQVPADGTAMPPAVDNASPEAPAATAPADSNPVDTAPADSAPADTVPADEPAPAGN